MLKSLRDIISALFGRGTGPVGSRSEPIFAITTATLTLQTTFDLRPAGRAWLAFRGIESGQFQDMRREIQELLDVGARETGTTVTTTTDKYGYVWVVLSDPEFEDLVVTMHLASSTLEERGFGKALLAALFEFTHPERGAVYLVYNFKRGTFYPFVPQPNRKRDNAFELRLKGIMQKEMPFEQELERWFALWDVPS